MPDNMGKLLEAADFISVLTMYGIAAAFGSLGGFCGSSIVMLKIGGISKWKKGMAVIMGLTIAGAFCSLMVFTALMSYEVFWGRHIIDNVETVMHASVFTGFCTAIGMMIANLGVSHVSLKYGNATVKIQMDKKERE